MFDCGVRGPGAPVVLAEKEGAGACKAWKAGR